MNRAYLGVDPGKNGYITLITDKEKKFFSIPLIGKEIDINCLYKILFDIKKSNNNLRCCIENVHAVFGSSAGATFEFGYVCGILEGILTTLEISYVKISPKKWQKLAWEGIPLQQKQSSTGKTLVTDTKLMSLLAAKRLFPSVDLRDTPRCKNPHDGKVDSLLIAYYCQLNY